MKARISSRRRQAGFSMLEGLVATGVLLLVVLGILPLFAQSIVHNMSGRESSMAANLATDQLEIASQVGLNSGELALTTGNANRLVQLFDKSSAEGDLEYTATAGFSDVKELEEDSIHSYNFRALLNPLFTANADAEWARVTFARQYQITLQDGDWVAVRQPASAPADSIHIKEVEMTVLTRRDPDPSSLLPGGPEMVMKYVKGFGVDR